MISVVPSAKHPMTERMGVASIKSLTSICCPLQPHPCLTWSVFLAWSISMLAPIAWRTSMIFYPPGSLPYRCWSSVSPESVTRAAAMGNAAELKSPGMRHVETLDLAISRNRIVGIVFMLDGHPHFFSQYRVRSIQGFSPGFVTSSVVFPGRKEAAINILKRVGSPRLEVRSCPTASAL